MTGLIDASGLHVGQIDIWPAQYADSQAVEAQRLTQRRVFVTEDGPRDDIGVILRDCANLPTPNEVAHRRFHNQAGTRQGVLALYNGTVTGEVEMSVACQEGLIHRSMLRYFAKWIFRDFGARRLVCRIRASDQRVQDFARRLGFRYEGRATAYFRDNEDASVWVMFAAGCPWLSMGDG